MCGILIHFRRTAGKVYNVWLRNYTTSVLWFTCFLMWLDVLASKTQLLHSCTCAVNSNCLIHSAWLIDKLAISEQLQHAANPLKFRHFTQAHSSIGPQFSLSWGHVILSSLTCAAQITNFVHTLTASSFYPSPEPHAHPWHAWLYIFLDNHWIGAMQLF